MLYSDYVMFFIGAPHDRRVGRNTAISKQYHRVIRAARAGDPQRWSRHARTFTRSYFPVIVTPWHARPESRSRLFIGASKPMHQVTRYRHRL